MKNGRRTDKNDGEVRKKSENNVGMKTVLSRDEDKERMRVGEENGKGTNNR